MPSAVACASLASAIPSNPEPARVLRELEQFYPKFGSYEGKRMYQLKPGDVFRFRDAPEEHWLVMEHPKLIEDVMGVVAEPYVV